MVIRPATEADLRPIAELHRRAFRGFFLTQLGSPFLRRYYRAVLEYPRGILLAAADDRSTCGFVAGFCEPGLFYRSLRRRAASLGLSMIPALARNPLLLRRALADFRRTGEAGAFDRSGAAELSSLAVDPSVEGRGVGKALVNEFVRLSSAGGAHSVYLTTDAKGNDAVNAFYLRLGFEVWRTFEAAPGRLMNELGFRLGPEVVECAETS